MADRKTSEHFHNLKEGSDPKRPMLVQSASRHHHDAFPDGSNGVKDNERQRQKDSYKKSHSKSQQKVNESNQGSHVYTFHESSPGEMIKVSTSTSSFDTAHHKKRSKTTSPKNRQDHMEAVHSQPHRAQASHSTLEALMARGPISQERLMSDRASPVGSFIPSPPQTKSASLSRDISPSRITAQVVSVLENYNPPLLHSALTGKLTQSPGGSAPPPNRTIIKSVHPKETDHQRMNSATLKHLQEASAESKRWGAQHRLPQALQQSARSGTEGSHVTLSARSHSPKSSHVIHVTERSMPFKSLPSSHFEKDKKGEARGTSHEQHSVGQSLHTASHHDISSVLNNVPTTVVYSHSPVRGPAVSSVGPVSVSGSIPSVRATPPVVRFIGPGDVPFQPSLQNLIMSMSETPGMTPQALAERIEAELKNQSAQKRTPSPAKLQTEHASPSSYARHPSSSPQTIYRTPSPSHSGHRVQVNTSNQQTIHRTVSPSHGLHRIHGHVSPVSQSQFPQGKISPVPSRPHGRASPGGTHVTVISGRVSPVPRHPSPQSQRIPASLSPNQGRVSPVPAHPDHVYRGRVSPVQDPHQMGSFPPPAHKHPELPPACRSGFPAVDLTHKHKQHTERRGAPGTQSHKDPSSVLSVTPAQSLGHAQAAVIRPFSISQPQVRVSAQPHVVKTEPGTSEQRQEQHHDFHPISQAPPSLPVSSAAAKFLPQPVPTRFPESKGPVPPHVNPFTFPSKAITSHVPIPSYTVSSDSHSSNQDKQKTPLSAPFFPRSASDMSDLRRPIQTEKENQIEMPRLVPEVPLVKKEERDDHAFGAFNHVSETSQPVGEQSWIKPFNMRLQNLANFPVNNTTYRSAYRAQSVAVQRAKACSITSAAKSLDILRQNLQRNINKEIDQIVKSYIDKFFKPAINNIQINNGQNAVSDEHLHAVQRQILEEAKKMYVMETPRRSITPVRDDTDTVSETGSNSGRRGYVRRRRPSDSNSEAGSDVSVPKIKKRKGRPPLHQSGRGTPLRSVKPNEPVKREGPKWNPDRLTTETKFVMGARANKALGLGATRGRLYIKHPDIFKYSGDQDDKAWLYEHHLMPATGGKAYMLLVEDIQDLSQTDEYRDSPNLLMDELYGFTVPDWILKKMSIQMNAMRTDMGRPKFQRSRSGTPTDMLPSYRDMDDEPPKTLPFSNFSDNPSTYPMSKSDAQVSPSNDAGDEMEFLSAADNESAAPDLSPFNVSARFDDMNSPSPPEVDNLDDPTFVLK